MKILQALWDGNPPVTCGFHQQRTRNAESVCMSWHNHGFPMEGYIVTGPMSQRVSWWVLLATPCIHVITSPISIVLPASNSIILALCEGNPPVTGGFPSQRASNLESIFMLWHHHGVSQRVLQGVPCMYMLSPLSSLLYCQGQAIYDIYPGPSLFDLSKTRRHITNSKISTWNPVADIFSNSGNKSGTLCKAS